MAYMNQERKAELAPAIKAVLKKYNMKGTIAVRNHSTLVVNVKAGPIQFDNYSHGEGYIQVNPYYVEEHHSGVSGEFLTELKEAMMEGNFDKSDLMSDYHHVGWYISINIGSWNKPYHYTGATEYFGGLPIIEHIELTAVAA